MVLRRHLLLISFIFLFGSVHEQRARLPPASTDCSSAVAGTWVGHIYVGAQREWYKFEADLVESKGDVHGGVLHVDTWVGAPEDSIPTSCGTASRQGVRQPVSWGFDGSRLTIDGLSWAEDPTHPCGTLRYADYATDHFAGVVDLERQEFQSEFNSSFLIREDLPVVFRRVACPNETLADGSPTPRRDASPKAQPPKPSRGWACW